MSASDAKMPDLGSPASLAAAALDNFHQALGDEPGRGNARLRITLHCEEHAELLAELHNLTSLEDGRVALSGVPESRKRLARELADVVYVAYGTAHAFGIDLDVALMEIHRAAMSKLIRPNGEPPVVREDGKILKPPEFVPPDMSAAIGLASSPDGDAS